MRVRCRSMCVWVCALAAALVSAQITFSRDWTGGKRAAPHHLPVDCTQFARLCKHFVHELKQAVSAEVGSRQGDEIDKQFLYDDE